MGEQGSYRSLVEFSEYVRRFREYRSIAEVSQYGEVIEGGRPYPLLSAKTKGKHSVVITAGFHGEEPAGPLTLLERLPEVVTYAKERDVALHIYPCINPSGFEDGTRYNRSGEKPNNDFLRYEVEPGKWQGELYENDTFLRWTLYDGGPKETRAIRAELEKFERPNAALDLHQDRYVQAPLTYAYIFGDRSTYVPLMAESEKHVRVYRNASVDEHNRTDEDGLVVFHDGSVTDYYLRRGVPFNATLETTTMASMEKCHEVNLVWIRGFIDLAARGL